MNHFKTPATCSLCSSTFDSLYVVQTSHKNDSLLYTAHTAVYSLFQKQIYHLISFPALNHISVSVTKKPFAFPPNGRALWCLTLTCNQRCLLDCFFSFTAYKPTFQDISEMQVILRVNQNFTRHLRNCPVLTHGSLHLVFSRAMRLSFTHLQADSSGANKYSYMSSRFSSRQLV